MCSSRTTATVAFTDVTSFAGLAELTQYVGWGASFMDYDNDSWPDIFFVTGHVYRGLQEEQRGYFSIAPRGLTEPGEW